MQAGLGYEDRARRVYHSGETVKLVVRVRNVGKEQVSFQYLRHFFIENPPIVTDDKGKPVVLKDGSTRGIYKPEDATLAPGKEIELYKLSLTLSDDTTDKPQASTLYGEGKFQLQYERVLGDSMLSSVPISTDANLRKLGTGKLDLKVSPRNTRAPAPPKDDKPSSIDLSKIEPPGGVPLPLVKPGTNEIGVEQLNKVRDRLEAVPEKDLERWVVELERIMDAKLKDGLPSPRQVCRTDFVVRLSKAFDGLKWSAKAAEDLYKRARTMRPADAKAWKEAFETLLTKKIGVEETAKDEFTNLAGGPPWAVPLVLIPVDALHEGNKYSVERGKKYLARMKQLTADDVALWTRNVDKFGGTVLDAAVNIILLDAFFDGERFQREQFKAAVERRDGKKSAVENQEKGNEIVIPVIRGEKQGGTLAAKLVFNDHGVQLGCQVYSAGIEVENRTRRAAVVHFDPKDLKLELLDVDGRVVAEEGSVRSGPAPMAHDATIPTGGYVGLSTHRGGIGLSAGSILFAAGFQDWRLKPGTYRLRGKVAVKIRFGDTVLDPEKPDPPEAKDQRFNLDLAERRFEVKGP